MPGYVIAISGPSGAGKTTLVRNMINRFGNAISLGIDDYPGDDYPPSIEWIERGENPDELETPQFFCRCTCFERRQTSHPSG